LKDDSYKKEIIDPGDKASKLAKEVCTESYGNCLALDIFQPRAGFREAVTWLWKEPILQSMIRQKVRETVENDGAGGKPQFFTLLGIESAFLNLGWEIIEMAAEDIARRGGFPALMVNEINAKRITEKNYHLFEAMMRGYGEALRRARLANITGEIAIMKHSITAFCDDGTDEQLILTWGGTCIGLSAPELFIDSSQIRPDMVVVGFEEPGYRCNGGTFFTNLILHYYGKTPAEIWQHPEALKFIRDLAVPSLNYSRTITRLVGWEEDGSVSEPLVKIHGAAHITGGGVWGKFGEILPPGVGAYLDNMPPPAAVLLKAQKMSFDTPHHLTDKNAYGTLHGGCGMLLVVEERDVPIVIGEAEKDGIRAQKVGKTTKDSGSTIFIRSRFYDEGRMLSPLMKN